MAPWRRRSLRPSERAVDLAPRPSSQTRCSTQTPAPRRTPRAAADDRVVVPSSPFGGGIHLPHQVVNAVCPPQSPPPQSRPSAARPTLARNHLAVRVNLGMLSRSCGSGAFAASSAPGEHHACWSNLLGRAGVLVLAGRCPVGVVRNGAAAGVGGGALAVPGGVCRDRSGELHDGVTERRGRTLRPRGSASRNAEPWVLHAGDGGDAVVVVTCDGNIAVVLLLVRWGLPCGAGGVVRRAGVCERAEPFGGAGGVLRAILMSWLAGIGGGLWGQCIVLR